LAQTPADFYKGKQIRLVVGNAAGGDYDLGARLLARYMPRHLPGNPPVIVQNMPGASGNNAANFLYSVAPKDGTVFGSFSRNLPSQAALGRLKADIDPRKYAWIGAASLPSRICVSWEGTPVKKAEDAFSTELIVGSTGAGSVQSIVPTVINKVAHTKFRVVEGYRGIAEIVVAMERHEVQGVCHLLSVFQTTYIDQIKKGQIRPLFNVEESEISELPGMPSIFKFVKDENSKQLLRFVFSSAEFGRPYVAPPDTPTDRVGTLRAGFANALKDKDLIAEAAKLKMDMKYRAPEDLLALIDKLYALPPELKSQVDELLPDARD
jgi:tripartite-type tricarboxylate transporter receptor subunit TctC